MAGRKPHATPAHFAGAAFDVVAMAASAGGLTALSSVLSTLPAEVPAAIVVVQHMDPRHRSLMASILSRRTPLKVQQAEEGDRLGAGTVYVAPPNRHLLVNPDKTLSLSQSELVHFVQLKPSIRACPGRSERQPRTGPQCHEPPGQDHPMPRIVQPDTGSNNEARGVILLVEEVEK